MNEHTAGGAASNSRNTSRFPISELPSFHRQITDAEVVFNCTNLEVTQNLADKTRDLVLFAHLLRIRGKIILPSKSVTICAREVIGDDDASIEVSGPDASDYAPGFRADDGQHPGEHGKGGAKGRRGADAGTVRIIAEKIGGNLLIQANGGKGGRGQDGGNGVKGKQGPDGAPATQEWEKNDGKKGGDGGKGGNAGAGGPGGDGGNAGSIEIHLLDDSAAKASVSCKALEGVGGKPGVHGQPGAGGGRGRGGINYECLFLEGPSIHPERRFRQDDLTARPIPALDEIRADLEAVPDDSEAGPIIAPDKRLKRGVHKTCWEYGRAAEGNLGPIGLIPKHPSPEGKNGVSPYVDAGGYNYNKVLSKISVNQLAAYTSISHLLMLLHKAEMEYLSKNFAEATDLLWWLQRLTSSEPDSASGYAAFPSGSLGLHGNVDPKEWSALQGRVGALLGQLKVGLDFYGLPTNSVPLLALDIYKVTVEKLIEIGKDIEEEYRKYWANKDVLEKQKEAFNLAIACAYDSIILLGDEKGSTEGEMNLLQNAIADLADILNQQIVVLLAAEDDFKNAVLRMSGCTEFVDAVLFITSVIAACAGAYENIASIVKTIGAVTKEDNSDLIGTIQHIKVVSNDIKALKEAYNDIKHLIKDDSAKILLMERDFENLVKDYEDLPEAQIYKNQMRLIFDLVQARNQKILDYTAYKLRHIRIENEIQQREAEVDRILAKIAQTFDPELTEYVVFMEKLLTESKNNLIQAIHKETRAYEYWALAEHPLHIKYATVADLEFEHGRLLSAELAKREERNQESHRFYEDVVLEASKYPEEFDKFRKTGILTFIIPTDHDAFVGFAAVTVSEVKISIIGARTSNKELYIQLVHHGLSQVVDQHHKVWYFSHKPKTVLVRYDYLEGHSITVDQDNLGGPDGKYANISPFALWTVRVPSGPEKNKNPGLRLGRVNKIKLSFAGNYLPFL